jgi:uncharacterized protein (TIGR00297 family)
VIETRLAWQSKLVLLLVLPFVGADVVLEAHWWATQNLQVAEWTVGLSALLGLATWQMRAATPWGAAAGAGITASLMFSTATFPYLPWRTALVPVLAVSLVAFAATRAGRRRKEDMGTGESRRGRGAAQVAANLGAATIVSSAFVQSWFIDSKWIPAATNNPGLVLTAGLAALAEAAADTASSELGQVVGGRPRMITTLKRVDAGRDGAVSLAGSAAGMAAAVIVAAAGTFALGGGRPMFWVSSAGGVFGLFFDSLLGATLEEAGWLNNDLVNFLSTGSAAVFALGLLALMSLPGIPIRLGLLLKP